MAERKDRSFPILLGHAAVVAAVQAALLAPLWTIAWIALPVALGHLLIDGAKGRLAGGKPGSLAGFALDQAAHLGLLIAACLWIVARPGFPRSLGATPEALSGMGGIALVVAAYAFNVHGGGAIVSGLLARFNLEEIAGEAEGSTTPSMGRTIGILERILLLTLVIFAQWGAIGLVLAAKSVARFKDLDKRTFSEYYLIGTLTSVLVAVASGLLVRGLLGIDS
jgi:hypothetical protein